MCSSNGSGKDDGFQVLRVNRELSSTEARELRALDEWVTHALAERARTGVRLEREVRMNRNFRNPGILAQMVAYCGIDEYATHLVRNKDKT